MAARADEKPVYITGGAGYLDLEKPPAPGAELRVDLMPGLRHWTYSPDAGSFDAPPPVTGPEATGLTGPGLSLGVEIPLGERFSFTPSIAVGDFGGAGSGAPEGATEYRKGLSLSYEFANEWKLGAGFYHFSEGRPDTNSDGSGMVTFSFTIPIGR